MRERELISKITDLLHITNEDAFVFPFNSTLFSLTTDTLVSATDVPAGMTPSQIGRKTVVMNLSDLAAMGACPRFFLCSLTLPRDYPALDLVSGAKAACDTYHCTYAGGDLNEGELQASGFAVGVSESVMLRSGAQPNDKIGITGDVGRVYAGLRDLKAATPSMREKIYHPQAKVDTGRALHAHSCIDISDGLSSELFTLSGASHVQMHLDSRKIPIHEDVRKKARELGEDPLTWALKSGEEYELLFTSLLIPSYAHEIGDVEKGEGIFVDGEPMPLLGWEHYTQ